MILRKKFDSCAADLNMLALSAFPRITATHIHQSEVFREETVFKFC